MNRPPINKKLNNFENLKDSFDLRKMKNLKKTQFSLQPKEITQSHGLLPKGGSVQSRSANLILANNIDKSGITNPMIDTPRFEPNQEQLVKKIVDLEKQLYEKERATYNRISEMQKQINWLTSNIYTLMESNENASKIRNKQSEKVAEEFNVMTSPPGLPIPKSKIFEQDLLMMQSPEPSPTSKNSDFLLIDAEINMINSENSNQKKNLPKRNVITPINECFTPDSCGSPYINAPQNKSR